MTDSTELDRSPEDLCDDAGLVHVDCDGPGWTRRRQGRGFSYRDENGDVLDGRARERIEALAIPPAWTEVWICARDDGHLLAVGRDDAGRRQHLYHPDFRAAAEASKYRRLAPFGECLEALRRRVDDDLSSDEARVRTTAAVVRLIDRGLLRVGTTEPDDDDAAVGATTLAPSHVHLHDGGEIELDYTAKGGVERQVTIRDERLAAAIASCLDIGSDVVFAYELDGAERRISASDVNGYLAEVTGLPFTAKDFRTWGGTAVVTGELATLTTPDDDDDASRALIDAVDVAAARLGNTREIARQSYVSPTIIAAYRSGALRDIWSRTRTGRWADRAERTTMRVYSES